MQTYSFYNIPPKIKTYKTPENVITAIPAMMQKMRLSRLKSGNLMDARLANINWNFRGPQGEKAFIQLQQPHLPDKRRKDRLEDEMGEIHVIDNEEKGIYIHGRIGQVALKKLGVEVSLPVDDYFNLKDDPEAGIMQWLQAADEKQQGCINAVVFTK